MSNTDSRKKASVFSRRSLAGDVAEELRKRILRGEIAVGTQLMQEHLAKEFSISKVPIREALFLLEAEGYVAQSFNRGAVVAGLTPAEVIELFELRALIEVWLVNTAMPLSTSKDIAEAAKLAEELGNTTDPSESWNLNWRFHEALYLPSKRSYIINHLRKLHTQTAAHVRLQYNVALSRENIQVEHARILDLYSRKDPKVATELREHLLNAAQKLADSLDSHNEAQK